MLFGYSGYLYACLRFMYGSGWLSAAGFGLLLVAICIVEVIGTVNHPNIHMDAVELSESKRAARILCAVEVCVIYTFTLLGADMMYVCHMAVAVILCAVLLLIAKILKQEVKRNEEN